MNSSNKKELQKEADKEKSKIHAVAQLQQSVWEAHQFLTHGEIEEYVLDILEEISSDEP